MVRLAEYSRDCLRELRAETGIAYDERSAGHAAAVSHAEAARRHGQGHRRCSSSTACPTSCSTAPATSRSSPRWPRSRRSSSAACACRATRPATASSSPRTLAEMAAQLGVQFRFGVNIEGLTSRRQRASPACAPTPATLHGRPLRGRARQLLAAAAAPAGHPHAGLSGQGLLDHACRSPMPAHAPESTVMDETHKVAVTRLGDRIRVGGTAELAGYNLSLHEARRADAGARRDRPVPARRRRVAAPSSGPACAR